MNMKILYLFAVIVFVFGCNSSRVSVTGTVRFEDGTPVEIGFVKFAGDTTQATAKIDKNGYFKLGELKSGDGVKPGYYKVAVAGVKTGGGSDGSPLTRYIDAKYEDPTTSGLTCEVEGPMNFDITVEKKITTVKYSKSHSKPIPGRP